MFNRGRFSLDELDGTVEAFGTGIADSVLAVVQKSFFVAPEHLEVEVEVAPISRTPYCSYRRSPKCPNHTHPSHHTRRSFVSK